MYFFFIFLSVVFCFFSCGSVCVPNLCLEQRYILSTLHVKNRYTFMLTDLVSMKKYTLYKIEKLLCAVLWGPCE